PEGVVLAICSAFGALRWGAAPAIPSVGTTAAAMVNAAALTARTPETNLVRNRIVALPLFSTGPSMAMGVIGKPSGPGLGDGTAGPNGRWLAHHSRFVRPSQRRRRIDLDILSSV